MEFAAVLFPFLAIMTAMTETGLMYFSETMMENGVVRASRMIKTGQAQDQKTTISQFKAAVCGGLMAYLDCENRIYVDSKVLANFASADSTPPLDEDGNLQKDQPFQLGGTSQIVQVRAYLPWKRLVTFMPISGTQTADGDMLLSAGALFRNEPFP